MDKKITVIFSEDAEGIYQSLKEKAVHSKKEKSIINAINQKVELIKLNIHYGDPINKKLIPKEYSDKYEIRNLLRIELPSYWRLLYTLKSEEGIIEIVSFVLDILTHKDYDKKLGYK